MHVVHTEALEVFYLEVLAQLLSGRLLNEHPIVHLEGARLEMEHGNLVALAALEKQLLGIVGSKQRTDVVGAALGNHKLAGGDIHKGNADGGAAEMHGGQEVVLPGLQYRLALHNTGRHQFGDASLDQFLRQLGVFQLIADGHTLAGTHQLRQVGVERMVRESGHLRCRHVVLAVVAARECDT